MKKIMTIAGEIPSENLGFCQCHEHLWIEKGQSFLINPALCIDDEKASIKELISYKQLGGGAILDAQPIGCGRNASILKSISEKSDIHIIASTGFHKLEFYPKNHWIFSLSEDALMEIFTSELEEGLFINCENELPSARIQGKAGQIKTALESGELTRDYKKLFLAGAKASKQTGAQIMVHIDKGGNAKMLADFFEANGIDLKKIIFCHMDRAEPDINIHKELCKRGAFLEYDTIGREKYHSDEHEINLVLNLLDAGFEDKLLMSLDVTRARLISYGGNVGLCYIIEKFLPKLINAGVSEKQIEMIFYKNPQKVLSF